MRYDHSRNRFTAQVSTDEMEEKYTADVEFVKKPGLAEPNDEGRFLKQLEATWSYTATGTLGVKSTVKCALMFTLRLGSGCTQKGTAEVKKDLLTYIRSTGELALSKIGSPFFRVLQRNLL